MHIDTTEMIDELLESLSKVDGIHPEDVPNIDLYMDQVTTFMDAHLESSKRYQEDKILTKTMINNYAKIIFSLRRRRKVFQRAYADPDLYLLFEKYSFHQRYSDTSRTDHRQIFSFRRRVLDHGSVSGCFRFGGFRNRSGTGRSSQNFRNGKDLFPGRTGGRKGFSPDVFFCLHAQFRRLSEKTDD